ncbi:ATP-binding protein [Patescibacteria group bacterium]
MNILTFLPLISALLVFFLGLVVSLHSNKKEVDFTFILFSLAISIWLFSTFMMFLNKGNVDLILFWDKFVYVGVVFIPAIMYYFGLAFTEKKSEIDKIILYLGYCLSTFFLILIPTNLFINEAFIYKWGAHAQAQAFHHIFLIYFTLYLILWFIKVSKYYNSDIPETKKKQTRLVFLAFFLLAITGSLGFLPAYNIPIYSSTYLSGLIFTLILAYAILKHRLFNVKMIATELFVFILWLVILAKMFVAETTKELIMESSIFVFMVIFGGLIIRSVIKEVKTREEMEGMAEKLKRANSKLQKLDEQKTEFISLASHQLRAPVTAIKGYASLITEGSFGDITPKINKVVKRILQSGETLSSTVNDFLNLSRIERGKIEYIFSETDIKKITKEIIDRLKSTAKSKGIKLKLCVEKGDYIKKVDTEKIKHVISNITDNAIKYTLEGSVGILLSKNKDKILIEISDSGIGISEEDLPKIFEKFKRLENASKIDSNGTGLGLYLAKQIILFHDGKIWAESDGENKGTSFFIEL